MLTVKTYLDKSPIAGIGLFAAEDIAAGALIWTFQEGFDRILTRAEFDALPDTARRFLMFHAFLEAPDRIVFTADNDRFTNHAETPNTRMEAATGDIYAARAIAAGEEITGDYRDFDGWFEEKMGRRFAYE